MWPPSASKTRVLSPRPSSRFFLNPPVPRILFFCCTVNRCLFGDAVAVFEGWEPVPGTTTLGSVLDVHWVQAVCDPRENCCSRQGQQRALSTKVGRGCIDMHCTPTGMQSCYITKNLWKSLGKKGIALMNIANNVHFTARLAMPWPIGHMNVVMSV